MRLSHRTTRSAFTLIELLVIMTIIVVILALTIGAIGKSFGWIKQKNTEQTMQKVILRLQRVIDRLYKEADDWPAATEGFIMDQANGSFERARILKVMYLYKWNFPNSYAEAYHNVQESRQLYDNTAAANFPGYPPARALLNKLRTNNSAILDPFSQPYLPAPFANASGPTLPVYSPWAAGTPSAAAMATVLPKQSSACMLAAFISANGSPDEFTNNEVVVDNNSGDLNPYLTDAWGTPFMFLRHGNFAFSRHRFGGGAVPRPAWTVGMVSNTADPLDFAPLEFVFNRSTNQPSSTNDGDITSGTNTASQYYLGGYYINLQNRANTAFPSLYGRDPFDPTLLLRNNNNWRNTNAAINPNSTYSVGYNNWLTPAFAPWLAVNADNPHGLWFRTTFGYSPDPAAPASVINGFTIEKMAYTPMVILSAGGDKVFSNWDDNLDSYRLQINVSGQQ